MEQGRDMIAEEYLLWRKIQEETKALAEAEDAQDDEGLPPGAAVTLGEDDSDEETWSSLCSAQLWSTRLAGGGSATASHVVAVVEFPSSDVAGSACHVKLLHPHAKLLQRATPHSAGLDLC